MRKFRFRGIIWWIACWLATGILQMGVAGEKSGERNGDKTGRTLTQYSITSANDYPGRDPRDWKLLGSTNGGGSWIVLDQRTNQIFLERYETKSFVTTRQVPCQVFRLEITHVRDPRSANSVQIADIELKGEMEGKGVVDLRPKRTDLVTVQGEYAPVETRRMVFDGNLQTKWLDFNLNEAGERGTWIQWEYDLPPDADPDPVQPLTRVAELNTRARTWAREPFLLEMQATVVWRGEKENTLVLHDNSGAALVKLPVDVSGAEKGTVITLKGNSFLLRKSGVVELELVPLIDNDGIHGVSTKSATTFLRAGRHPVRVEWFNGYGNVALDLEYEGPGIARQRIPESALYREERGIEKGVDYAVYEGAWELLPDFGLLKAKSTGKGRRVGVIEEARRDNSGLVLTTFLEVPRDGEYQFHLVSDDGSRFFIGPRQLQIEVTGTNGLPVARRMPAGSLMGARDHYQWVSGEGEVKYVGEAHGGWEIVLQSRSGSMTVLLGEKEEVPQYLLGSRVRILGICVPTVEPDEHVIAGEFITPNLDHVRVSTIAAQQWRQVPLSRLSDHTPGKRLGPVRLRGMATWTTNGLSLRDESGVVQIVTTREPSWNDARLAEVIGQLVWEPGTEGGHDLLQAKVRLAEWRELGDQSAAVEQLPALRYIEQVHGLSREEAARGYPVKVRGVVTCAWPESENAVIQDGTRGIFVPNLTAGFDDWPEVGDYFEVEGRSDPGGFAPVIIADRVSRLGKGAMPEPIRPTWAQLLNGSMDMQYVEIRGVVISAEGEKIWLLVKGGKLQLQMENAAPEKLKEYQNAVVRLRGCLSAAWDAETRKVRPGELRMNTVAVSVEREAEADMFSMPTKKADELLLFDARADDLQRIKLAGQILAVRNGVHFMADGETGVRFVANEAETLFPGDLVEVVGFPRTEGPALFLREAMVRRKSVEREALPAPVVLTEKDLLKPENDARRVMLRARSLGVRGNASGGAMELQIGQRTFLAQLRGQLAEEVPAGSLVEVSGVYVGHGSENQRKVDGFELLVTRGEDVRLVTRPPWWTMQHMTAAGIVAIVILIAAAGWIGALRREVARKTSHLQQEVEDRKTAEEVAIRARRQAEAAADAAEAGSRAKSQFLATMSHEIRTPMNGILGMNNLLLETGLTREQRELAETVNASGEALLAVLNDVLDFSKIEAGKMTLERTEFQLREVVDGAVDLIAQRAQEKGLEVNYLIAEHLPARLVGDPGRFRQVLLNLLSNALKFTEAGEIYVEVNGKKEGERSMLHVHVRDTGIGMSREVQGRLFQAFEQADQSTTRRYGGTGLGLAICKRMVELMEGAIGVISTEGKGSTFWFSLPFEKAEERWSEDSSLQEAALAGGKLLVVEQQETTREVITVMAASWKMEVESVASLGQASAWLRSRSEGELVLVLVDCATAMKEAGQGDIFEVVREFRRRQTRCQLRIGLLCSMRGRPSDLEVRQGEIGACVNKPVRRNLLRKALQQLQREVRPPEAPEKPDERELAAPRKNLRILLAEDNPVNQRVALKQLARLGYEADVASSGIQVLEAAARVRYDVILMDCHMPEMDGYEATARIRQLPRSVGRVRIIAMTANAMQGDREKCLEAGMDDYIAKPVKLEELRAAIEQSDRVETIPA